MMVLITNLYDHNFTALEFNIDGEVPLQEIVSNVDYDKNDNQNPVDEMKYYIFDGSYSIQDIFNASYDNENGNQNTLFTPADFSIFAQQHETGMYTPQALVLIFRLSILFKDLIYMMDLIIYSVYMKTTLLRLILILLQMLLILTLTEMIVYVQRMT